MIDEVGEIIALTNGSISQTDLAKAFAEIATNPALRRQDLAELYARRYTRAMVDTLAALALNPEIDPEVRRKSARDVLEFGHGKPAMVVRLPDSGAGAATIDADLDRAEQAIEQFKLLEAHTSRPPNEWPPELREALMGAARSEDGR